MSIYGAVSSMIDKFGSDITIRCGESETADKAFIQPLRYKNKMYLSGSMLPSGYYDGGHYLFIGPPELDFAENYRDIIIFQSGKGYIIKRAEKIMAENRCVYVWAILTLFGEPTEDDYDSTSAVY